MIKKIALIFALALVLAIGVFGTVNTTHAQQAEAEDAPAAEVMTQEDAAFEFQYAYGYGNAQGDRISTESQSQVRTQTRELQDGECDGDPIHQQLRKHLNVDQNAMRQMNQLQQVRQELRDGSCNGACRPDGQGQTD